MSIVQNVGFFSKLPHSLKIWIGNLTFKSLFFYIIIMFCLLMPIDKVLANPTVWDVLRNEFKLDHHTNQPAVHNQVRWLMSHPSYLRKLAQSEPYIYHIVTEIKKKHLPGEIALIPMIESAYDPFAYSGAGAAGLWQLMPGTGSDLGLKHDWWFDARRSIGPSTDAALHYFIYLKHFFHNNWILAIAAYDSGEGTISRLIKNYQSHLSAPNFWQLPVPSETRAYVPRLLALAEIIQNPQRYRVQLPEIMYMPYFEEVNIGSQIDLNHAAQLAEMPYRDLLKLNPGFNRWATSPFQPYKLLLPTNKVELFSRKLALIPPEKRVSLTQHHIGPHDNLNNVAKQYHTTVALLKNINQLKSNQIKPGQTVMIPSQNKTFYAPPPTTRTKTHFIQPKQYKILHIVQKHESMSALEKKYRISRQTIAAWNHLSLSTPIHTGQTLVLWKKPTRQITHIIRSGDSLSKIAKQYHTPIANIQHLNPGLRKRTLRLGQRILIG